MLLIITRTHACCALPLQKEGEAEEKKEADEDDVMDGLSQEDKAALETACALSLGAKSPGIELPVDFQVRWVNHIL